MWKNKTIKQFFFNILSQRCDGNHNFEREIFWLKIKLNFIKVNSWMPISHYLFSLGV